MFIGHLPAGYLVFKAFSPKTLSSAAFAAGMIGSIAPDIDMFWFYGVDARSTHHHDYFTHRPFLWILIVLVGFCIAKWKSRHVGEIVICFGLGGVLHMLLDSIVGKIAWAWPFFDGTNPLVVVPATHSNWIVSFLTHWTFLFELAITLIALWVFCVSWRRKLQSRAN